MNIIRTMNFIVLCTFWLYYSLPIALLAWAGVVMAEKAIAEVFGV